MHYIGIPYPAKSALRLSCAPSGTSRNQLHNYRGITLVIMMVGVGIGLRLDELAHGTSDSEALAVG